MNILIEFFGFRFNFKHVRKLEKKSLMYMQYILGSVCVGVLWLRKYLKA